MKADWRKAGNLVGCTQAGMQGGGWYVRGKLTGKRAEVQTASRESHVMIRKSLAHSGSEFISLECICMYSLIVALFQ